MVRPPGAEPQPRAQPQPLAQAGPQTRSRRSDGGAPRQSRVRSRQQQRAAAREARWRANRFAVPYWTDGPKVTLGIIWFILMAGAVILGLTGESPSTAAVGLTIVGLVVAGLAGLQAGHAWFPTTPTTRSWTAGAAMVAVVPGMLNGTGVLVGAVLALFALGVYTVLYRGHRRSQAELFDVLVRSAVPAGLAMACLVALAQTEPGGMNATLALILMVSAYEVGDFLVGTGSANAVEGPLAGVVALGVVAFFLFLVTPEPFTSTSVLLFAAIAALSCPLGQILASALLPHGTAWAPALRRIDSYLVVAPLWLLLIVFSPGLAT